MSVRGSSNGIARQVATMIRMAVKPGCTVANCNYDCD
jgi:hypothetical protein